MGNAGRMSGNEKIAFGNTRTIDWNVKGTLTGIHGGKLTFGTLSANGNEYVPGAISSQFDNSLSF